jgi:hypothetical protein
MREAIPPLPNTPSVDGAQLQKKHRDNFTLYSHKTMGKINVKIGDRKTKNPKLNGTKRFPNLICS